MANRGFVLRDFKQHVIHTLKKAGYTSALAGIQHLSTNAQYHGGAEDVGYDHILTVKTEPQTHIAAADFIRSQPDEPFWLTVGFFETHREFPTEHDVNPDYVQPPALFPDTSRHAARYGELHRDGADPRRQDRPCLARAR